MQQIEYRPRGPLGNLVAGLMNLGRGTADILAGVRRDKFGNILPPDDANLTESDRARRDEWEAAGGQGPFGTNLWDY